MKRSTFRKSSLISSVALLLVAIVALSGATFAWFSSNESTTASGIQMKASAASGLYIANSAETAIGKIPDTAWKGSISFGHNLSMAKPTSPDFKSMTAPTFITTKTDRADGVYVDAALEDAVQNTDYVAESIWVKGDANAEKSTLKATVTIAGSKVKGYERVALYDYTTQTLKVLAKTDVDSYTTLIKDADGKAATGQTLDPAAVSADGFNVDTNWDETAGRHFMLYVWFEGQDASCYNATSGADLNVTIGFELV